MSEVSQPKELIETIEKALEAALQGKWERTGEGWFNVPNCANIVVKDSWGQTYIANTFAGQHQEANAHLIANAPEWLRALLEDRERVTKQLSESINETVTFAKEINRINTKLEQVKAERDKWKTGHSSRSLRIVEAEEAIESLRTELSAKDKVLELYAREDMYTVLHLGCSPMVMADRGGQARSILSQYRGES